MITNETYGPGGYLPGVPNAPGVPAQVPACNLLHWEQVQEPETRPAKEYRDETGALTESTPVYPAQSGYTVHRAVGETTAQVRISCPLSPYWNETCGTVQLQGVSAGLTNAQIATIKESNFNAVADKVDEYVANGCPIKEHTTSTAEPTNTDYLLGELTEQDMILFFMRRKQA